MIWRVRAVTRCWLCPRGPVAVLWARCLPVLLALLAAVLVARRGVWRGECRLWVPWAQEKMPG